MHTIQLKSKLKGDSEALGSYLDKLIDQSHSKASRGVAAKSSATYSMKPMDDRSQGVTKRLKVAAQRQVPDSLSPDGPFQGRTSCHRKNYSQSIDFVKQFQELKLLSEQEEKFEFAQNVNKENVIDERLFDFNGGKVKIMNKSSIDGPKEAPPLMYVDRSHTASEHESTKDQLNRSTFHAIQTVHDTASKFDANRDSSHLYLQDVKSFLNLRNAALNFKQKKKIQNSALEREGLKKYV